MMCSNTAAVLARACTCLSPAVRGRMLGTPPSRFRMHSAEANQILRAKEFRKDINNSAIKSFEFNQLPSNKPCEDTHAEVKCLLSSGHLFGVFDGHAGPSCSYVVSNRVFNYIAASLLPPQVLDEYIKSDGNLNLISHNLNDESKMIKNIEAILKNQLSPIYNKSLNNYVQKLQSMKKTIDIQTSLESAFLQLDYDISNEVLEAERDKKASLVPKLLSIAMSGCVACVAHVDGPHIHIANVGDCSAVLGSVENNEWVAKKLVTEHNTDNIMEVQRIIDEHPNEINTVIKMDRLLGQLAPLRSMGDYRYKWSKETMNRFVSDKYIPPNYITPPYLSAKPDITYHRLTSKDKFLILATDGLWDMLTPLDVVKLAGQHIEGKAYFTSFQMNSPNPTVQALEEQLSQFKQNAKLRPKDRNGATHLLRHALGGVDYEAEQERRLARMLSLPDDIARSFRDDITVTIIHFDSDYLSKQEM